MLVEHDSGRGLALAGKLNFGFVMVDLKALLERDRADGRSELFGLSAEQAITGKQ